MERTRDVWKRCGFGADRRSVFLLECAGLLPGADRAWVLAHASCDFLRPLLYPAHIVVVLKLLRVGRSSFEMEVWIAHAHDLDAVVVRGRNVVVSVDPGTGGSVAFSQDALERLRACFLVPPPRRVAEPGADRSVFD